MSSLTSTVPKSFGRYEVQAEIGEGAMGRVYRAFDPLAHRVVAIKTLKSEYLTSDTRDEYLKRFKREAQAAGALSHPHIITVFDVGEDFFVMELLEGATLQAILTERGKLEPDAALRILAPVAEALDYAHTKGTIHRDVKPGNIMVLPDGRPKIMDFGVAHLTSTVMTAAGQFLGSPAYMAPEQIMQSEASPRTDLFSLAVVAYESVTGRKPFEGDNITTIIYKVVHEEPPPPRKWNLDLPARFDDIFGRALAKDPAQRFATATAFVAALEMREIDANLLPALGVAAAAPQPVPAEVAVIETHDIKAEDAARTLLAEPAGLPPLPKPPQPPRHTSPVLVVAAVLALVALGLVLIRGPLAPPPEPSPTPPLPTTAGLHIETEPAGAAVSLDGADAGRSPLSMDAAPGPHTVRVAREGFAPAELSFDLVAGLTMAPLRFVLQPTSATFHLRSEPDGAAVLVDGKPAGTSPIESLLLDPGAHEVRVELKGYQDWTRTIEARAGESLELEARLELGKSLPVKVKRPRETPRPESSLADLTPDVAPPKRISGDSASYPEAAKKLRLQGTVTVEMVVTPQGEPTEVRVTESAGEILDQAVLEAVRRWRFEPAQKKGAKVSVRYQYRQRFQLGS